MLIGLVKWFDSEKKYGVVGTPDGKEYFLHMNSFSTKPRRIFKKTSIAFQEAIDAKRERNSAKKCHLVGERQDWISILSYLGRPDNVGIEVKTIQSGRRGNPYYRRETQNFSLIALSIEQFLRGKAETEIVSIITEYFDNGLNPEHFISYGEYVESGIVKVFPDSSSNILNKVFVHFRNNLNEEILFAIWKKKKFRYISYADKDDYEIPEHILKSKIDEIELPDLNRILNFSFGPEFCSQYINTKFSGVEQLSSSEIKNLYQFLGFFSENEQLQKKMFLDSLLERKTIAELAVLAWDLDLITDDTSFAQYRRLLQLIPSQLKDEHVSQIKREFYEIVSSRCVDDFKPELWIKGIIDEIPFEYVSAAFFNGDTKKEKRIAILAKLQLNEQFELLKVFSSKYNHEKAFDLIEELVRMENSFGYHFKLSEVLFDQDFWVDKKCTEIISLFNNYVRNESSDALKFALFIKGFVKDVPQSEIFKNIAKLGKDDCKRIFRNISVDNEGFIQRILEGKLTDRNIRDIDWLYDLADEFLDREAFSLFDKKVFETIAQPEYFDFWSGGKAKIFPDNHIGSILNDKFENYSQIEAWISSNIISAEHISSYLLSYLLSRVPVIDRLIFRKQLNHIKYLLQLDNKHRDIIAQLRNDFYSLILWFLDNEDVLDFEMLKSKFIYFAPDEQVRIIRKLFFLKASGRFELTVEKLNELTRFDVDLYKTGRNFDSDIPVDISTDVVIKTLQSYEKYKRFIVENELFALILNDLNLEKTRRFKLENYFERCLGREVGTFDWDTIGTISKITALSRNGVNVTYFAIKFKYNLYLIEQVKKLPGRKWNTDAGHWGVPLQYEKEVIAFGRKNDFFFDFEGSNYSNNTHLIVFERKDRPNGISFCEGRLANRPHKSFNKEFWWCAGQPCFNKCETIHSTEEWEQYTLLDFCEILGFETDEINKMGDVVPKGHYYLFIALINRFNRLLDKLYCHDCNHILFPSDFGTGHFAAHTVVRFQCRNEGCDNNEEVYLNHCLNGQCNCIVDSRTSKKCPNGLFICNNCGSCCSHNMLQRRLENLQLNGGYIHHNLIRCVEEKLGHLERAEYFCYKCRSEMEEISSNVFRCSPCNVQYNTAEYRFKRPHVHLRNDTTTAGGRSEADTL
jgi:''Cold-shock'' DNA-binding domain.